MPYLISENFIDMNRSKKPLVPTGMVVHETATPGATDEAEQKYFDTHNVKASVHAFVDYNSITQTLPWLEKCWGAGGTANSRFIQVELCHFDGKQFYDVWSRAVWLFAWVFINVLKVHTVTKDNLMSHQEVSLKWHETDHTDPYGFFADNGKTIDQFRAAVQAEINNQLSPEMNNVNILCGGNKVIGVKIGNATLAPVRVLAELLGQLVKWDAATNIAYIGTVDKVYPKSSVVRVAVKDQLLDATMIDGSSYVPVRKFAELLGRTVGWDSASNSVSIT